MHQITREVWSQLSPRERDTMATKLIQPFAPTEQPDNWTSAKLVQQWVHLEGILVSQPYPLPNSDVFGHQWRQFKPTTDMNDALALIERDFILVAIVRTQDAAWVASLFSRASMNSGMGKATTIAELPAALTFAAVVAASQPGSIAT